MIGLSMLVSLSLISEARDVLAHQSVNPAAVQFEDVRLSNSAVCGKINIPNRQGGYDGFRQFVYYSKTRWGYIGEVMVDGRLIEMAGRADDLQHLADFNEALKNLDEMLRVCVS